MKRFALLAGVLAVIAMYAIAQTTPPTYPPPPRTITVTGTAERQVVPDLAIIVLAVQTQAETVAAATQQNNTATNRVIDAVRALNITGLRLRTLGFEVSPIYEQPEPNRPVTRPLRIIAYQVVNRVEVRVTNTDATQLSNAAGRVLDAALRAGANRVDSVVFDLDNPQAATRDVLADATRNARDTAQAMATAAGVQLGPLLSLSSTPFRPQPLFAARATTAEAQAAVVPIQVGPLTVSATVTIEYEIR